MWFLFGLATIAAIALAFARSRPSARWDGEQAHLPSGEAYVFEERHTSKGKPVGLRLGVACPEGFHLTLQRERAVDRFFKDLGISQEFATRDRAFDDRFYIVAEDRRVGGILYREAPLRAGLLKLFDLEPAGLRLLAVECRDGRLWADYGGETTRPTALVAREVVPPLAAFAAALESRASAGGDALEPDHFARKAWILATIAAALALNGVIQWYRSDFFVFPSIIDARGWVGTALALTLVVAATFCFAALVWLKRSARTHLVIVEAGLFGLVGAFGTSLSMARDLNESLDTSPVRMVDARVMQRHGRGRRSLAYRVSVQDWDNRYGSVTVRLPGSVYDALPPFSYLPSRRAEPWLRLQVRTGAFGLRYVAGASVIPAPAPVEEAR